MKTMTANLSQLREAVEAIWLRGKYKSSTLSKVDAISNTAVGIVKNNRLQLVNASDTIAASVTVGVVAPELEFIFIFDVEKTFKYLKNFRDENDSISLFLSDSEMKMGSGSATVKIPLTVEHPNMEFIMKIATLAISSEEMPTFQNSKLEARLAINGDELGKAIKFCNIVGTATFQFDFNGKDTLELSSSNFHQTEQVNTTITLVAQQGEPATVEFSAPIDKFCKNEPMFLYLKDDSPILLVGTDRKLVVAPRVRN
tara:strand:- start:4699 stop:5466 length:768 start_codon:yes stop_codon:yes gene_type:complete